jgi:hypothetical protein
MAVAAFLAGLACLTLPETKNIPTSEVFEERKKSPLIEDTDKEDKV